MATVQRAVRTGFASYRTRVKGAWSSPEPYPSYDNLPDILSGDAIAVFLKELPEGSKYQADVFLRYSEAPSVSNIDVCLYRGNPYSGEVQKISPVAHPGTGSKEAILNFSIPEGYYSDYYVQVENTGAVAITGFNIRYVDIWTEGDDTPPTAPTALSPNGGEVDGYNKIRLSWQNGTSSQYPIDRKVVQISKNGVTSLEAPPVDKDASYYDYPAGRLKDLGPESFSDGDTVYWRVGAKTLFSDYAYSEWLSTVVRFKTPVLTPTTPVNESKRGNESITFRWTAAEATASSVQLYYSYDQETWYSYSGTIYSTYATIPAEYFRRGNVTVYWKVRGKNQYNDWGEWSNIVSFTVAEALPTSTAATTGYIRRSDEAILSWYSSIAFGTINGAEVEYYDDQNDTWVSLGSVSGTVREITVPGNTFPLADYIRWHVRSFNAAHEPGEWSQNTISTIDRITYATPENPINNVSRNEKQTIYFGWATRNSINSAPTGADLEYRYSDGEWQTLGHVDGNIKSYRAGPDTFIGAVIYWRVRAYNQDGVVGDWSSEALFTTLDKAQVSVPIAPDSIVENADGAILFKWSTSSQSGEVSRGADLQYSRDGVAWINFGPSVESGPQLPGNVHEYEAPGRTFPAGIIFWRVRSYNRNVYAGEWSNAISFVSRTAPIMQDIGITAKPWAVVNWQSDDQFTYEVFVDGESLGSFFGGERQYQLPDYLSDGDHTVGVRVLGSFSLWSQILETQVHIENSPALQLVLKAMTDIDTELVWTGGAGDFYIYRDGLMIGHTNEHSFTDRTAVGVHDYLVVERLASGDYNASAVLTRTPSVDCQHIAALAGGEWIAIPHTLKSQSDPSYSESQEVEYNYLAGSDYPTASIGSQRDDSASYSAVFLYTEQDEHKRFLALRGKPVIFKTADGEVMIGILHAWERKPKLSRNKQYYTAYTFNIQRVGWGDFIDDTI